jgi:hypothetical protein
MLLQIDGFRLHRLADDPAQLGGPAIRQAALLLHVLALGMAIRRTADIGAKWSFIRKQPLVTDKA